MKTSALTTSERCFATLHGLPGSYGRYVLEVVNMIWRKDETVLSHYHMRLPPDWEVAGILVDYRPGHATTQLSLLPPAPERLHRYILLLRSMGYMLSTNVDH